MSWREAAIGEIANVKGGKRLPDGHQFASEPTPFLYIRARDIGDGKIQIQEPVYLLEQTQKILAHYTVSRSDIVITIVGANVGDVGYISEEFEGANLTENAAKLEVNSKLAHPYFLKSFLATKQSKNRLSFIASGAAQGKLGLYKIKSFQVPLPPLNVQSKIADLVKNYDDLIENNRRRIALLEDAARMLYREWFVHFRFPGHEHVKIIDGLPEGWERRALGEIASVRKGKNITKETVEQGDVPVVAGGLKPAYYHSQFNAEGPVITVSASGANAGHVALYHSNIWASDCSFLSSSENAGIWTLFLGLKARQAEITGMQQGAAQPHVYPKQLERLALPVPPECLGKLFEESVDANFRMVANLERQSDALAHARDLLLPRLMNGEIAV